MACFLQPAKAKSTKTEEKRLDDERKPILENGLICSAPLDEVELALKQKKTESIGEVEGIANGSLMDYYPTSKGVDGYSKALRLDRVCRAAFPSAFVLFNVAYWLKYWHFGRLSYL